MSDAVTIVEVGPRDGLQNIAEKIPTPTKIRFIDALAAAGHRRIEATAFVAAPIVPQLEDAAEVMAGIQRPEGVLISVLVPNLRGFEGALAGRAGEVAVFTAASESFNRFNINATIEESFERIGEVLEAAGQAGLPVRAYLSCIIHCPYEGRIDPKCVVRLTRRLLDIGCYEVSLGETIGRATPNEVRELSRILHSEGLLQRCAGHFHDTFGMGVANALVACEEGIRVFDSSAGGLGGCPFAPGAAGNVATEDLMFLFEGMGMRTGLDFQKQVAASSIIEDALGRPLPSRSYSALGAKSCT